MQLRVWQEAIELYREMRPLFVQWAFVDQRVASNAIAACDSIHRNTAEGYARRSIREYRNFLNIAIGSLGETVSGLQAYAESGQLEPADVDSLDARCLKLENGLINLVASLERKQRSGSWDEEFSDD
ncbi:MAG: four helix bundle protein [Akkermansiaceae bacterium]|nr:four helix bundle protein [Akkermansiaceae bacterium]